MIKNRGLNSIKVLFISKWYPNRNDAFYGIFIKKHAEAVASFCDVAVIYIGTHSNSDEKSYVTEYSIENKIKTVRVYYKTTDISKGGIEKVFKFFRYLKSMFLAFKIINMEFGRPDLIHVNVLLRTALFPFMLKKLKNIPYIITEHWAGYYPETEKFKGLFRKFLTGIMVKNASAVTTVSKSLSDAMKKQGLDSKYFVVPNIVEPHSSLAFTDKGLIALMVCDTVDSVKKISGVIDAFAELRKEIPGMKLHLIGEGPDRDRLEEKARNLLLNEIVFFHDYVPNEVVHQWLKSAAFLIVNSHIETFSVIAAEAVFCGTPVLTTNCGGPEEFIGNQNGRIIEKGSNEALKEGIKWMYLHHLEFDKEKMKKEMASKFSPEKISDDFKKVYTEILQIKEETALTSSVTKQ